MNELILAHRLMVTESDVLFKTSYLHPFWIGIFNPTLAFIYQLRALDSSLLRSNSNV